MLTETDRREIDDLMVRYSNMIDERRFSRLGDVFVAEAFYDLEGCGLGAFTGTAEIDGFLRTAWHPLQHVTVNVELTPESRDRVRAFSRCLAITDAGAVHLGTYRDVIVRTRAGWRLQERVVTPRAPETIPAPS